VGQTAALAALALAPDGQRLATRGYDQIVRLWRVDTGQEVRQLTQSVIGLQKGLRRLGVHQGSPAHSLAFSPDGRVLAAGSAHGGVGLWDAASGRELLPTHQGPLSWMAVAPDGRTLTTTGADLTVRQWDLATGRQQRQSLLPPGPVDVVVAPDGRLAAFSTDLSRVQLWDVPAGKPLREIDCEEKKKPSCVGTRVEGTLLLSPDARLLGRLTPERAVRFYDVATGKQRQEVPVGAAVELTEDERLTPGVVFAPDGKLLAAYKAADVRFGGGNALCVWDVATGKLLRRFEGVPPVVAPPAFSPDGRALAAAHEDGSISVRELASAKERFQLRSGRPAAVLAYAPDSRVLAAAGQDRVIRLWDALTGEELARREGHQGPILGLAFAARGRLLVSASQDSTALVWDLADLRKAPPRRQKLDARQLQAAWEDLAGPDGPKAQAALRALHADPVAALALLRERLRPTSPLEVDRLARLIRALDHDQFEVRSKALAELEKLGEQAEPALRQALGRASSAQLRNSIEQLLDGLQSASPEVLRVVRGVELLEGLEAPEARELLRALSRGAEPSRLTREARAALERRARLGEKP
jgi:WD40 repeat protein